MRWAQFLLVIGIAAATAFAVDQPRFEAGVARVEITPSKPLPMYGYGFRKCLASETHDPLFAKVLVLGAGGDRVAIVTLDIGMYYSARLRQRVADELKIPTLLLASSHTHAGPYFLRSRETSPELSPDQKEYLTELEDKLFGAIQKAASSMFPARIGMGRGKIQIGYNRLVLCENGRARANFQNPEHVAYGPVDPEFIVLKIEDESGATKALMVHYACHAVVLQGSNCKYSADYPGAMEAKVEAAWPGVQCHFVQGGAGDINPGWMVKSDAEGSEFKAVDKVGEVLAGEVLRVVRDIKAFTPDKPEVKAKLDVLTFPERWEKDRTMKVGIATVLINGTIAIATVPGEPHHRLQTFWKAHADVPWPLFYGYTAGAVDEWPGYVPDLRNAAYGGYGADASTRIAIGAGEDIMQRHLINLFGLRGMWLDKPGEN